MTDFKVRSLMDEVLGKFHQQYESESAADFDESLFPLRGRLNFKQYIPVMSNDYACKLYRLCSPDSYTWNIQVNVFK